ncbi:Smr/MutS family protein [Desulfovibrio ferrophilus]|uniref:Smr protein/MutS2 n=1 Tax=Desulfovibrio ferrophilus TaxID=241368 RepID=A0A2Z6AUU7_9BACT|nr:Smr/MutS family protein [Desulfovibrio ferrophilus]BBD07007.1 Smr protein/MutS2 [Desulfovibrio ferrophilus]
MSDEFNNPFQKLKKAKLDLPDSDTGKGTKSSRRKANLTPPPEPAQTPYENEDELFRRAMSGAKTIQRKNRAALREADGDVTFGALLKQDEERRKNKGDSSKTSPPASKPVDIAPQAPSHEPVVNEEDDSMFMQAMGDVAPMDGKGRDLPKEAVPPEPKKAKSSDALAREHLRDLVRGKIDFQLEFTSEYQHGHVEGLDPKIFNKLRAGAYATEAHLDLHGMNVDQALLATVEFIRKSYTMGKRHLIIVTGRGKNSPEGRGILRDEVQTWLTHEPLRRVVLAFVTAQPRDGGAGALYVLLRKFKKSLGKVHWDRIPKDWSLYE